jgi:hypothetical protein
MAACIVAANGRWRMSDRWAAGTASAAAVRVFHGCLGSDPCGVGLEANGQARATTARRLCTIAGFYRYAVEEDLLEHSPAAHVRRPRLPAVGRLRCDERPRA